MKKILLTGGGTLGSVTPLLALKDILGEGYEYRWLGTRSGPERAIVEESGIEFAGIFSGKLRRYFDWRNITDLFLIKIGFWQAVFFIKKYQPDLIISAGSFVSVPIVWAGKLLGIKVLLYQLDARPGLANKICLRAASAIAVTWQKSVKDFAGTERPVLSFIEGSRSTGAEQGRSREKVVWAGALIKNWPKANNNPEKIRAKYGLNKNKPLVLFFGGGTGSLTLNSLAEKSAEILKGGCAIVQLTGKAKKVKFIRNNYLYQTDFLLQTDMLELMAEADIVVCRAGMATLFELAMLEKTAIIIPLINTHQEDNAEILASNEAAVVLPQTVSEAQLSATILQLIKDKERAQKLASGIKKLLPVKAEVFKSLVEKLLKKI